VVAESSTLLPAPTWSWGTFMVDLRLI
jgi:hypothetical protein